MSKHSLSISCTSTIWRTWWISLRKNSSIYMTASSGRCYCCLLRKSSTCATTAKISHSEPFRILSGGSQVQMDSLGILHKLTSRYLLSCLPLSASSDKWLNWCDRKGYIWSSDGAYRLVCFRKSTTSVSKHSQTSVLNP